MEIAHRNADGTPRYTNHLVDETSPYLRQHAHNPVDWYPWGGEALGRARRERKPITSVVGYAACHWCHVMAHEIFEDEATAALMNELYVNIKVDREERPDLDRHLPALAPDAHTARRRLAADHVPDARRPAAILRRHLFPAEARFGLPAFRDLLTRVAAYYRDHSTAAPRADRSRRLRLARFRRRPPGDAALTTSRWPPAARGSSGASIRATAASAVRPKFPHPPALERLLRGWRAPRRDGARSGGAAHGGPDPAAHG